MRQDFEITRSFMVDQPSQLPDMGPLDGDPSQQDAARASARKLDIPYVDLHTHDLHPHTVKLISEAQARRFKAMVLEDRTETYLVGFVDPWDLRAQDEIAGVLKRPHDIAVIAADQLF